ncbi:hypothetical protein PQQ51_25805, partial [Paraburkholderia xenovorans]|uniref:hypothetical protein n=1 Tax=Paraburkholderia xenovorans TaxID=36873 RepID=UPI0038BA9FE9
MSVPMAVATGTAAIVVGNGVFSSAGGDAVAHTVESAALLIDENAAVVATVGGMRPGLWRKPFVIAPLVFAALGLMGAVLYRLYLWVMALWPTDADRHVSQAESTMTTDVTQSFVASTEAIGEVWPSSVKLNEMIDDFIVTLTEEDDDFLAMGQSVIPSEDAMPSDLIDLVLYQFEQEDATDRSARSRRSVGADNQPTIAAPVTNELSSWIRSNWPVTEAFTPPQNDPMRAVAKGIYESKNGNAYMFIGGAYWKFVSTGLHTGYLENEKTKVKFILLRSMAYLRPGWNHLSCSLRTRPSPPTTSRRHVHCYERFWLPHRRKSVRSGRCLILPARQG